MPGAVVTDANAVLSALIGGRASLVLAAANGPHCLATTVVQGEVRRYLPVLAAKRHLDLSKLLLAFSVAPITWKRPEVYGAFEAEAKRQLAKRDADDWPTLALAIGLPIWSQDKDFSVASVTVYSTGDLLDALRDANNAVE